MRQSAGPHHRLDQQPIVSTAPLLPATSDSVDTLTTTTGSQHTVSAEVVEVEEHDAGSDGESGARETLKLTARGRPGAHTPPRRRSSARDETKKEIQDDDEATLRELLIRYPHVYSGNTLTSNSNKHTLHLLLPTTYKQLLIYF